MKTNLSLAAVSVALTTFLALPVLAAEPGANGNADAGRILRQMSLKLGGAQRMTFEAHRHIDAAFRAGRNVPEDARVTVAVMRPNKIMAKSTSKDDIRHFYANGVNISMLDVTKNLYAIVPMFGSIDTVV